MAPAAIDEKERQEECPWFRSGFFADYNAVVGYYQVQACLENGHGPSVLDLACGDGVLTELLARSFESVVGVDASSVHLADARGRVPEARFIESLIEELDIPERFDSVFMLNVLEHVVDPIAALRHAASYLKEDGVMVVQVPNAHAINRRLAVHMGTLERMEELSPFDLQVAGHRRYYTLQALKDDALAAGLNVKATGGVFYKMLSSPQMDWFLRNGLWQEGGFGWGRMGAEPRDWKSEFCRACYELGKERPEDCNIVYVVVTRR
jgi:2-polyprenyl-3-methyl-5-hydroxy-6-metoxy-1,4-benzoquinol methylase